MRMYALALTMIVAGCGNDTTSVTPSSTPPVPPAPPTVAPADMAGAGHSGDGGVADAGIADAGIADAGVADAGIGDAGIADAGIGDAGIADAGGDGGTVCATVALATAGTMARAIAVDDSGIYFSTNTDPGNVGSFLRAPLAGGTAVALGSGSIFAIVVNDAAVFTLDGGGQILRWAKSGGPPVTLVSGSRFLPAVQIADAFGYLYWTTDDADFIQIFRRPDDGSGATARIGAMAGSGPIAFDSTHLWQSTTHGIFRSAPDGSGQTRAITSPNGDTFGPLAVDDAHVFVGTVPGRLWAADSRVGATLTLIASTSGSAVELLADGGRLYVRDSMASRSRITRYAADGSGATVLADRAGGIGGMAIHGGFLYYTSTDDSTVYRVCK